MTEIVDKHFPIFINLKGRKILMAGAGNIGFRRAEGILAFGGNLHIVAPCVSEGIYKLRECWGEDRIIIDENDFEPGMIDGFDFVLSVTDDREADKMIYDECKRKGIPVNIASDKEMCDFYFPALIEYEDIIMGVGSSGTDHRKVRKISAEIRNYLEKKKAEED